MKITTHFVLGQNYALLKIEGQAGGYIAKGRTVQEAIINVFNIYYVDIRPF